MAKLYTSVQQLIGSTPLPELGGIEKKKGLCCRTPASDICPPTFIGKSGFIDKLKPPL